MRIPALFLISFLFIISAPCLNAQSAFKNYKKVVFKHINRQTFSMVVVITGGTANYSKGNEGIESLALNWMVKGGISGLSPNQLSKKLDSLGIQIEASSELDYSTITFNGLKKYWQGSYDIISEIILNPSLDESVFNDIKEELAFYSSYFQQDPEARLYKLSIQKLFKDSDYAKNPEGTPNSLNTLKPEEVKNYKEYLSANQKGFIALVGDFNNDEVSEVESLGNKIFKGNDFNFPNGMVEFPNSPLIQNQNSKTSYLRGVVLSPALATDEGFPMLLGMEILSTRIFQRIRNKEGLSYAPRASYATGAIKNNYSLILLDTENPKRAVSVIKEIVNDIIEKGISKEELALQKVTFLTEKYLGGETTTDLCVDLYSARLNRLDLNSEQYIEKINEIQVQEVNQVMTKYLTRIFWAYLGNAELVSEELLKSASSFGK